MIRKRIFTILTAVFMVLAFSAMSFAANQVVMKTTVPNIPRSTCYQAGTDTMEFDDTTTIGEGDVIQYTLNNGVTFCKPLNMWLRIAAPATGVVDAAGTDSPVSAAVGSTVNVINATHEWGFLIQAAQGSQIATLTLRVRDTATNLLDPLPSPRAMIFTAVAPTDKLIVKLFDGKVLGVIAGFFKPLAATPTVYDTAIVSADNAICIDTLTDSRAASLEYVQNTPDSIPVIVGTKLNFSGDYVIAHIMTAQTYNLATCKGAACGNIVLGTGGQSASCTSFDYETIGNIGNGYCNTHTAATGYLPKFVLQSSQPFELTNYVVTAQILVNGVAGEHGVYWSNTAPTYKTSATNTCGTPVGATLFAGQTYYNAAGTAVVGMVAPGANNCAFVPAAGKAVSFATTAGLLFGANHLFFELNLPDFVYNLAEVNANDVVSVRVTVSKATCGTVGTFDLCIGTFIASCPTAPAGGMTTYFPYFTSLSADANWWNGIAIVNSSSTAGTVLLTAYEQDGSVATFTTPSIAPNSMYVNLLENIPWTGTGLGGSPAYISATSSGSGFGSMLGFGMIANPDSGESMGYLSKP